MDWHNVTAEELLDALREVDWKAPRPVSEFFNNFSPPKSHKQWTSRAKCNVYYYRTNYLVMLLASFVLCFLRNPAALLATAVVCLALLCLNDPFALSLNDQLLRAVRSVHPRTAQKARALNGSEAVVGVARRSRGKKRLYILLFPRGMVVGCLALAGALLMYLSRAWLTLSWAILLGLGLPMLHATIRSPNLKARLASAREEFRAVWRGYQAEHGHDYTL